MMKHGRIPVVLFAAGLAFSAASYAAQPLPMNPGLIDAMKPAAPRTEQLSLTELEDRVRATKALTPLQKMKLKAEVDDLLARFRVAHAKGGSQALESLREPYEKLMAKMEVALRKDRQLARDVAASREPLWDVLTDRTEFAALD
jgi:hypothetical protein